MPGEAGIGATWFVSTLFQCYFLAPFVYEFLLKRLNQKESFIAFFGILICGALLRHYEHKNGIPFYDIYTSVFGGMLFNVFTKQSEETKIKKFLRPLSIVFLLIFIAINTYFYGHDMHMQMYMYRYPTV